MESSRKQRWKRLQATFEPGFRRMLLVSLLLHLLFPILYHAGWFPSKEPARPPVYRVNLVNKIVKNPQAGRPEAVAQKPKPKPKPKPAPVKPKPKPKVLPKPAPAVTPKPKPAPAPAKQQPTVSKSAEQALQKRLEQLRTAQAQRDAEAERQAKLDALRAAVAQEREQIESPVSDAPVGMPTGKGDEAGVTAVAFIRELIRANWTYSPYLSGVRNPEAKVRLYYSVDGELRKYEFLEKSRVAAFDKSLVDAIIKSKNLGQPLPDNEPITVIFNLKDMLDRR